VVLNFYCVIYIYIYIYIHIYIAFQPLSSDVLLYLKLAFKVHQLYSGTWGIIYVTAHDSVD